MPGPYKNVRGISAANNFSDMDSSRRRLVRLPGFDYASAGAYFVTICARGKQCLFGEILEDEMRLNPIGQTVASCWEEVSLHFSGVALDAFAVMPNRVHGILLFTGDVGAGHARPLPVVVGSFKSAASRRCGVALWQRDYWERVIRNEKELNRIRHYIDDNVLHRDADREHPLLV